MLKRACYGIIIIIVLLFFNDNFIMLFILSIFRNPTFPLFDNLTLDYVKTHDIIYSQIRKGGSIEFGVGVLLGVPLVLIFNMSFITFLPLILAIIFFNTT